MRLKKLRELFKKHKIDGYMISSKDEFLSEYTAPQFARLGFVTTFYGSNGIAIITQKKCALITDGRYTTWAKENIGKVYSVLDSANVEVRNKWFCENLFKMKIGYDPMTFSASEIQSFDALATMCNFEIKALESNLVDEIWQREVDKKTSVFFLEKNITGEESRDKILRLCRTFEDIDYLLLTNPDSICWLLNMRGDDVPFTPLVLCFALIKKDGSFEVFTKNELDKCKKTFLKLAKAKKIIQADKNKTPHWFFENAGKNLKVKTDPIELMKAVKNSTELKGIEKAHTEDGIAVTKFIKWISKNVGKVSEIEAAEKLLEFRKESPNFVYPSFETISAFAANGAIIHYKPEPKTNKKITKDGIYLLDSGGQYLNGTTDITRTMCFGKPTKEQVKNFTLVLKGHIALARAKFPEGTTGSQLDVLARQYLWEYGLDYNHGTGHGVGHFLSVHEGPQRIGKLGGGQALLEGMIISNEPGFYKVGEYGIRIENLVQVIKSKVKGFLEFKNLTKVEIDMKLVDKKMLTNEELIWIKENFISPKY